MISETDLNTVLGMHKELMASHGYDASSTFMESLARLRSRADSATWAKLEENFEMAEPGSKDAENALIAVIGGSTAALPFSNLEMISCLRTFDDIDPQTLDDGSLSRIFETISDTGNVITVGDVVPADFIDIARACLRASGEDGRFYLLDRSIGKVDALDDLVWESDVTQAIFIRINDATSLVSEHHPNWKKLYEAGRIRAILQMPRPEHRDDMPLVLVVLGHDGQADGDVLAITLEDLKGTEAADFASSILKAGLCDRTTYRNDEGHHCFIPADMVEKNRGNVLPDLYLHNAQIFEWQRARRFRADVEETSATLSRLRTGASELDRAMRAAVGSCGCGLTEEGTEKTHE